jgi:hypothetical protein
VDVKNKIFALGALPVPFPVRILRSGLVKFIPLVLADLIPLLTMYSPATTSLQVSLLVRLTVVPDIPPPTPIPPANVAHPVVVEVAGVVSVTAIFGIVLKLINDPDIMSTSQLQYNHLL